MMKIYNVIFFIYLITISFIAFYPKNAGVDMGDDKINHILAFIVYAILFWFSWIKDAYLSKWWVKIFLNGLLFGIYIEFVQYFLPYRSCDFFDLVVDILVLMSGILLIFIGIQTKIIK